jgi:hypothetical protein
MHASLTRSHHGGPAWLRFGWASLDNWFEPAPRSRRRSLGLLLVYFAWLGGALFLAANHIMWRDEVRALSLALRGDTLADMPALARGYGHPLLWHLLLRIGHDLTGSLTVLPILAFAAAAKFVALLSISRLRLPVIALFALGGITLYQYTIVARNYGVSVLLMFGFAALYPRLRKRGIWLGLILALLCNSNVHSVVLAGALWLFWARSLE